MINEPSPRSLLIGCISSVRGWGLSSASHWSGPGHPWPLIGRASPQPPALMHRTKSLTYMQQQPPTAGCSISCTGLGLSSGRYPALPTLSSEPGHSYIRIISKLNLKYMVKQCYNIFLCDVYGLCRILKKVWKTITF